jgi:acid phosphatase type 7
MPRTLSVSLAFALLFVTTTATAAITKGPWVQRVTPTTAIVRFELDAPAPASVTLGPENAVVRDGGARIFESAVARTLHSVTLTDLEPATRYAYTVSTATGRKLAALTTAPAEDSNAPFRFVIYGDNRSDDAAHAAVVRGIVPVQADFLVHTGDFVENGASRSQWQTFFDIEAPLMRERCLFSCVGNHELVDGTGLDYVRYFGPGDVEPNVRPEHLNGTFRWANTRFFLLNGMVGWRSGADRAWLEQALAKADAEPGLVWRIAVVHHGPWSSGPHGNNRLLHEAGIPSMLRAHKVDLVLAGHDHVYERGWAEGMAYVVTGGGGAPTYRIKNVQPYARTYESVRHFVEASVSQAAINLNAIRPDGTSVERCALRKDSGWDCDAPAASPLTSGGPAPSAVSTEAPPQASRCACRAVGSSAGRGAGAMASASFALCAVFIRRRRRGILRA